MDGSINATADDGHGLFAVVDVHDQVAGFASVCTRHHFTGQVDAYIGELVIAEGAEGQGAGRVLLSTAEGGQ